MPRIATDKIPPSWKLIDVFWWFGSQARRHGRHGRRSLSHRTSSLRSLDYLRNRDPGSYRTSGTVTVVSPLLYPLDPHTFSEGNWTLQAYINSLQSPPQKVCGSIGIVGSKYFQSYFLRILGSRKQKHAILMAAISPTPISSPFLPFGGTGVNSPTSRNTTKTKTK